MNWALTHLSAVAAGVAFVLVAMSVLRQHRTPQSAFAWLLFVALIPYLGVPAFIALGARKTLPARSLMSFADAGRRAPGGPGALEAGALPAMSAAIERLAISAGLPQASSGNRVELIASGEAAYRQLVAIVEEASHCVDLTFYKFADDSVGRDIAIRLARRARQGVRVRLLLDGYGSRPKPHAALRELQESGGELRIFSPLSEAPIRGHINLRNHRKMAVGDRRRVFAGGANIALEYMGPTALAERWVDLTFHVEGPCVGSYAAMFEADWRRAGRGRSAMPADAAEPVRAGDAIVQLLPSGPDIEHDVLHDALVLACHQTRRRILIVTPYFLPSQALADALSIAARRGVDVRLIVPARSNQRVADLGRASFLREAREAGVNVLAHPGMVHAKAMVFDDCGFAGSANFDVRSLFINFESMLVLHSAAEVGALALWAEELARRCSHWRPADGLGARLGERLFRLAAPLM